ncbi:uncharacterized protein LOC144101456 [Amblyomma americanum]
MKTTLVVQILVIIAAYILQENVCQKTSSRQAPGPSHGNCTPAACKKTCEEKEPDKVLLETSCPASYICHCTYQEDCTEDICSAYCKETYPPEELLESKCIDNFCYCNRTTTCSDETRVFKRRTCFGNAGCMSDFEAR